MPQLELPIALAYILAIILLAAGYMAFSTHRAKRSARERVAERFGKAPPNDDRDIHTLASYYNVTRKFENAPEIDAVTWNDLDMDKVFRRINACESSVGEEYLYAALHRPFSPLERLQKREAMIAWLNANPEARSDIQYTLACLGKEAHNGLAALAENARAKIFKHASLLRVLAVMPLASAALLFIDTLEGVAAIVGFALINLFIYYYHKLKMDADFVTLNYLSAMLSCCKTLLRKPYGEWEAHTGDLRAAFAPFQAIANSAGRFARTYISRQAMAELQGVVDLAKQSFLVDVVRYNKVMRRVSLYQDAFRALYAALGEIDAAINVLSFRNSLPGFCLPSFHEKNAIAFEGLYHPLLTAPVTNGGEIARNSIVTGSNASGKSTFIKALAVNGILAQTLNTCCADSFAARPALVMTSMAVRDDIIEGESYFITELKSLKRILDMLPNCYCACYIDEILRGTNTPERIAASCAVLNYLAERDCICVVASHDIELAELLASTHDNYSFAERVTEAGIQFDYKLRSGTAKTRNAILLLEHMGFEAAIVKQAQQLSSPQDPSKAQRP